METVQENWEPLADHLELSNVVYVFYGSISSYPTNKRELHEPPPPLPPCQRILTVICELPKFGLIDDVENIGNTEIWDFCKD